MGTRLKSHIYGTVFQQVGIFDSSHGIDLGMGLTTLAVPSLTDDGSVGTDYHGTHHGVGRRVACPLLG